MYLKNTLEIELDFEQYENFIHIVSMNIINENFESDKIKSSIKNLCIAMWLTKQKYSKAFEKAFEEFYSREFISNRIDIDKKTEQISVENDIKEKHIESKNERIGNELDKTKRIDDPLEVPEVDAEQDPQKRESYYVNIQEGESVETIKTYTADSEDLPFIFNNLKHLPFNPRRVHQLWKNIKLFTTKVEGDRIKIKDTIEYLIKNEGEVKLKYHLENLGQQKFNVFIENDGPMMIYSEWADHLINDLVKSNASNLVDTYYFEHFPSPEKVNNFMDYNFFDSKNTLVNVPLSSIIKGMGKDTINLFFSDAGALDNKLSSERMENTIACLKRIKNYNDNVLWINPVVEPFRWDHTSASYIAMFCKMVPFTYKGIFDGLKNIRN